MSDGRGCAWVALLAILSHAGIYAALHVLHPELPLRESLYTDYLYTSGAPLARVGLVVFALTWGALALMFRRALPPGWMSAAVVVLLALASVSLVYASTLEATSADPRLAEGPSVLRGALGIFRLGLFISLLVASLLLRSSPRWKARATLLAIVAGATLAVLLFTLVVLLDRNEAGLGQRIVFVLTYAWVIGVAAGVIARPVAPGEAPKRDRRRALTRVHFVVLCLGRRLSSLKTRPTATVDPLRWAPRAS